MRKSSLDLYLSVILSALFGWEAAVAEDEAAVTEEKTALTEEEAAVTEEEAAVTAEAVRGGGGGA